MKKYGFIFASIVMVLFCISCNNTPSAPVEKRPQLAIYNNTYKTDIYWQMIKDGEPEMEEYELIPTGNYFKIYPSKEDGYTLKFYRVTKTVMKQDGDKYTETRIIGDVAETHVIIDHYRTDIYLSYTTIDGLTIEIEKREEI